MAPATPLMTPRAIGNHTITDFDLAGVAPVMVNPQRSGNPVSGPTGARRKAFGQSTARLATTEALRDQLQANPGDERCEAIPPQRVRPCPYPPSRQSHQPKTVGPAFVGVIRIKQRRCLIMAAR